MMRIFGIFVLSALLPLSACMKPLPRYPSMEASKAVEVMRARDGAIQTISAEGTVLLSNSDGSSVTLDAAIVARWPGFLRIRAWKFGQPAFDVTCTPEGLWIYLPEDARKRAGGAADLTVTADQFRRVWGLLGPAFLAGETQATYPDPRTLVLRRAMDPETSSETLVECEVDAETLTVRSYRFIDPGGRTRQSLSLSSYRLIEPGPLLWPRVITADGDSGRINIRLREPEINGDIPVGAFEPPRRAAKQP